MLITVGGCAEPPFPGLDEGPFEAGPRDIEVEDRLTVDPDGSLADERSRVTGRRRVEVFDEEGREVHRIALRQRHLRDLVRRLMLTHDAGEVLLAPTGAFVSRCRS